MTIELERAYVFSCESVPHILNFLGAKMVGIPSKIQDDYLSPDLRMRLITREVDLKYNQATLIRKSGNKSSGQRIEESRNIDPETSNILVSDSKLRVRKTRYNIYHASPNFKITLDVVELPMKIAILEIESTNGQMPPTANDLFGVDLLECPLAAWDLFRQKIGICGAPSSGKTEVAKILSGLLNIKLKANSCYVPEYTTSFIQKYNRHPIAMDQFMLWYSQRAREDNATSRANIVISDCPTFLSYVYMIFHNKNKMDTRFRIQLTKLYKRVLEDVESYGHIIYLRPKNLTENNIRFHSQAEIYEIANRIYAFLKWHNIPHTIAEREDARKILKRIFFMNDIKGGEQK